MPNVPPCKNPHHPASVDRSRAMVILGEEADRVIFACQACKDIEKILSVQVRTLPKGVERAKHMMELQGVKRAETVKRNQVGRITYFH